MSKTRAPRVGFVGAGQLARMSQQAAVALGVQLRVLAADARDSAALVIPDVLLGAPAELSSLQRLAGGCDVVTLDHELVDPRHLNALEQAGHVVRPSGATMDVIVDKRRQRAALDRLGCPGPAHIPVASADELVSFGEDHGWPVVAKAASGGYDGRGVWIVERPQDAAVLVSETAAAGLELLVEAHVAIDREVAAMVARRPGGQTVAYPLVETVQSQGICREVSVPADVPVALAAEALALAGRIAEAIDVVGILAVEMFVTEGRLLVNELAARPHNSGHWSIEGARTSQFENHLRAVLDWPLGETGLSAAGAATVNILGPSDGSDPRARVPDALAVPGARVHLYGKSARPGRKLGHVTALGDSPEEARTRAREAAQRLTGEPMAVAS